MIIKIKGYWPKNSCAMFYPVEKYIAVLTDDDGNYIAESGKCSTKRGARMAGHRLLERHS